MYLPTLEKKEISRIQSRLLETESPRASTTYSQTKSQILHKGCTALYGEKLYVLF